MKIGLGVVIHYSSTHEKTLPDGSFRCRMELDAEWNYIQPHLPAPKGHGRPRIHDLLARSSTPSSSTSLRAVGSGACSPTTSPGGPPSTTLLQEMAHRRYRGVDQPGPPRTPARSSGKGPSTQRWLTMDSQSVKSTAVGGEEERGYDGGKKVKGRKRHLLVDTEGFVLKAKVHSAKVLDHEGIKTLLQRADRQFSRLSSHLWVDAGYRGEDKGKDWVEKTLLGWSVDLVERPRKPTPEGVLMSWAREWAKEGVRRWIGRNCCLPRASRCYLVGG
jgi:putative transposase